MTGATAFVSDEWYCAGPSLGYHAWPSGLRRVLLGARKLMAFHIVTMKGRNEYELPGVDKGWRIWR